MTAWQSKIANIAAICFIIGCAAFAMRRLGVFDFDDSLYDRRLKMHSAVMGLRESGPTARVSPGPLGGLISWRLQCILKTRGTTWPDATDFFEVMSIEDPAVQESRFNAALVSVPYKTMRGKSSEVVGIVAICQEKIRQVVYFEHDIETQGPVASGPSVVLMEVRRPTFYWTSLNDVELLDNGNRAKFADETSLPILSFFDEPTLVALSDGRVVKWEAKKDKEAIMEAIRNTSRRSPPEPDSR